VLGQRKIPVLEPNRGGVTRQKLRLEHGVEDGAIRALQILVNEDTHRTLRRAFHQMLIGSQDRPACQQRSQGRALHN